MKFHSRTDITLHIGSSLFKLWQFLSIFGYALVTNFPTSIQTIFQIDFSNINHPDPTVKTQKIKIKYKNPTAAPEKNRENKTVSGSGFTTNSTSGSSSTSTVSVLVEESTTRTTKEASSDVPAKTVKGQIISEENFGVLNFIKKPTKLFRP